MDVDFHYYATYVAARCAGYPHDRALIIATSSIMIDEAYVGVVSRVEVTDGACDPRAHYPKEFQEKWLSHPRFRRLNRNEKYGGFGPLSTFVYAEENKAEIASLISFPEDEEALVWAPFHFLPGNELTSKMVEADRPPYWEPRKWPDGAGTPPEAFKLLCRPHSPLSRAMARECVDLVSGEAAPFADYLTGIIAHVFVDTWAHQDFAGVRSLLVNGVVDGALAVGGVQTVPAWARLDYSPFDGPRKGREGDPKTRPALREERLADAEKLDRCGTTAPPKEQYKRSQEAWQPINLKRWKDRPPLEIEKAHIGHAFLGNLPDHSAIIYRYRPSWQPGRFHYRDNPLEYMEAFLNLVSMLSHVRTKNPKYEPLKYTLTPDAGLVSPDVWRRVGAMIANSYVPPCVVAELGQTWDDHMRTYSESWEGQVELMYPDSRNPRFGVWNMRTAPWIEDFKRFAPPTTGNQIFNPGIDYRILRESHFAKFVCAAKTYLRWLRWQMAEWDIRVSPEFDGPKLSNELDGVMLNLYGEPSLSGEWLRQIFRDFVDIDVVHNVPKTDREERKRTLRWCLVDAGPKGAVRRRGEWRSPLAEPEKWAHDDAITKLFGRLEASSG